MAAQYWYQHDGLQRGPVSGGHLKRLAAAGDLIPTDLVWEDGATKRVTAAKVKGLFDASPAIPESPVAAATPVEEPAASDSAVTTATKPKAGERAKTLLLRGWREALVTAGATAAQSRRLMAAAALKQREHRLRRSARQAQCELGERLFKEELGDADVVAALTRVNEQILSLAAAKTATRTAANERSSLQARLAEPYLDRDPPVGMESDHHRAVECRRALNEHCARREEARQGLWPAERGDRVRVAAGAVAMLLIVFTLGYRMIGPADETNATVPDEAVASSVEGEGTPPLDQSADETFTAETWNEPAASAEEEYANETQIGTFQNALSQFSGLGGGGGGMGAGGGVPAASAQTSYQVTCRACGFTQTVGSYEQAEAIRSMHQQNASRMSAMQRGAAAQQHITVVMPVR